MWLQQEKETAAVTARESLQLLWKRFNGSINGDVDWPFCSPDLSTIFFLWIYLKEKVMLTSRNLY